LSLQVHLALSFDNVTIAKKVFILVALYYFTEK